MGATLPRPQAPPRGGAPATGYLAVPSFHGLAECAVFSKEGYIYMHDVVLYPAILAQVPQLEFSRPPSLSISRNMVKILGVDLRV